MLLRHCCRNFVLSTKSKQIEISFDIVAEIGGDIVAKNDNNVEATFDLVERTKFYDTRSTLLPFVATKSNVGSTMLPVASTMLLVWTGLYSATGCVAAPLASSRMSHFIRHFSPRPSSPHVRRQREYGAGRRDDVVVVNKTA